MSFRKVLVLDGSAYHRDTLRRVLVEAGFDAETAETTETLEKALEWWRPDALLVDAAFASEDGLDVVAAVARARDAKVPTILLGARRESVLERSRATVGADRAYSTLVGLKGVITALAELQATLERRHREAHDGGLDW